MKQAEASDFEVKVLEGGVNVKPTLSYYWFERLIRPIDMIERLGPISSSATVRHMSWACNTGDYNAERLRNDTWRRNRAAALRFTPRAYR
jgi:hypothetical protein